MTEYKCEKCGNQNDEMLAYLAHSENQTKEAVMCQECGHIWIEETYMKQEKPMNDTVKKARGGNISGEKVDASCHPINCDQVSWLLSIFDRYLPKSTHPSISRERQMMLFGMLYEVMEIARLRFEDSDARWNGTPEPAKKY